MAGVIDWFHKFFNPHCEHCHELSLIKATCQSCEVLKAVVAQQQDQIRELIKGILPKEVVHTEPIMGYSPINPSLMPFRVKRAMLEKESLLKAEEMQRKRSISELEKDLDISDAADKPGA